MTVNRILSCASVGKYGVTFLVLLVVFCSLALGQETTGAIRGTVLDPSGAAVPSATIEVAGTRLVRSLTIQTDQYGAYTFPALPSGIYTLSATAPGFATVKQSDIQLQVGRLLTVDFRLEVGGVTETVTITGQAAMIDVAQSGSATNVDVSFFSALPKSRSFESLIELAPGARREPKQAGYQIDGSSGSENVFIIDGVDVTNLQNGGLPSASRIPMEFVQELQIKSSGFEAQYGGATGGVVNTVVRSGSNEIHGEVGLYHETDGMNAGPRPSLRLNPIDDNVGEYFHNSRDGLRYLNPYFSLGGPVMKDKVWFFASYSPAEWRSERTVTFLSNNVTSTYQRYDRQTWLAGKLDAAPTASLRTFFSFLYSPYKVNGLLPTRQGTDAFSNPWADRGYRQPGSTYSAGADYSITPKLALSARGGYNYRNYKDYGIPRGTRYRFANSNLNLPASLPVPANLQAPAGNFTPDNRQTTVDIQDRWNLNLDATYIANAGGQHNLKFGWGTSRLHNEATAGAWPDGYIFIYWNATRSGITVPGTMRGKYGYYIDRFFATSGDVGSDNTSFYIHDGWNVTGRLRLNIGMRFEREFIPSFRTDSGIPSRAIEFGFGQKAAPRIGAAYDLFGNGKTKIFGNFGLFYDMMKYELPRGSFGGDQWLDRVYPLDDPNFLAIGPGKPPAGATLFETVDWRIPSNSPDDNSIDPDLKPMRVRVFDFGAEHQLTSKMVFNARYTRRQLDRAIEDVGVLTSAGEHYYIANPGFGLTADPKTFGPGIPVTPKAQRNYDAVELRLDQRFARNLMFQASYTWSRLYGNYGGLASSDENGRQSPNVNRYFDLPFMSYDARGQLVYGRLATDRPHAFKLFGTYNVNSKLGVTRFSPIFFAFSGTPLTTEVQAVSTVPIFVNGRGDLGRTPRYTNTDLAVTHEFKLTKLPERYKLRVSFEFFNIFNQATPTGYAVNYIHPNDGGYIQFEHETDFFKGFDYKKMMAEQELRVDPTFGLPNDFQSPRSVRFGIGFTF